MSDTKPKPKSDFNFQGYPATKKRLLSLADRLDLAGGSQASGQWNMCEARDYCKMTVNKEIMVKSALEIGPNENMKMMVINPSKYSPQTKTGLMKLRDLLEMEGPMRDYIADWS
ncbi:hypothetical protein FRB96_004277 [Tulasnella sp. 330]|nr:hypothetical protein FRB96_004277 [Tulasnella sp. 330]KAG8877914.1 hypothetical protein FRB97_002912 [Tulasnella sp. 331]KAG8889212.1 hypothetical protein FRB98_005405 [Tulasnella sp. 332]